MVCYRGLTKVCNPEQDGDANPEICYCQFSKKTVLSPIGLAGKFQVNENSRFISKWLLYDVLLD